MNNYPVRKYALTFDRVVNEERAKDAWRAYVEAMGWTVVGDGAVIHETPQGHAAVGRVIETDETLDVKISADLHVISWPSDDDMQAWRV